MAHTPKQIAALARSYCPTAIKVLSGILTNAEVPMNHRIKAAQILLDRGVGLPTQTIAGDPERPLQAQSVSDRELARWIALQLSRTAPGRSEPVSGGMAQVIDTDSTVEQPDNAKSLISHNNGNGHDSHDRGGQTDES